MLTAGIVAEYNPFHNGHKYQIMQTRKAGATHIVSVMSGCSVQRGDIAVFNKYYRAQKAVENGADLVIELPAPYSCSNGEVFARAAVQLLAGLGEGTVDMISFGCENEDISQLEQAAKLSAELEESDEVKKLLSAGASYPLAVAKAAEKAGLGEIFSKPNNVLAVEYIKAVNDLAEWIKPNCVKRSGSGHDSHTAENSMASASYIRSLLCNSENAGGFMPYVPESTVYDICCADRIFLYKILTADRDELSLLPDINENIINRFMAVREDCTSAADFCQKFKSRNITMARVRRMLLHLVLGVRNEDIKPVPYGRILAFNKRGTEILSKASNRTLTYDTSLSRLENLSEHSRRICSLELKASALQQMCINSQNTERINDYKQKIKIIG